MKEAKKNSLSNIDCIENENRLNVCDKSDNKKIDAKSRTITRVQPATELSVEKKECIRSWMSGLKNSAIAIAEKGRHSSLKVKPVTKVSSHDKEIYLYIFLNQDSSIMETVKLFKVNCVQDCCLQALGRLTVDALQVCEDSRNWKAVWFKQRKYRITGSICYEFYTYTKNSNPDWKSKCNKFIEPRNFKTEATEYGTKFEKNGRDVFKKDYPNMEVVETGLIIS